MYRNFVEFLFYLNHIKNSKEHSHIYWAMTLRKDFKICGLVYPVSRTQLSTHCSVSRRLQKKQESERAAKLRLQKRLEALRPMASVSGRHNPAQATHTLFDLVHSYSLLYSFNMRKMAFSFQLY